MDKVDGVGLKILQAQQASRYRNATVHMPCTRHAHATCTCRATHMHMTLQAQDLTLPSFTDRVHIGPTDQPGADKDVLILTRRRSHLGCLCPQPLGALAATTNSATIGGEAVPCDVVVWNPHAAASPPDLPPPAYLHFVCVEPGLVAAHHTLPEGRQAVIRQKIVPA